MTPFCPFLPTAEPVGLKEHVLSAHTEGEQRCYAGGGAVINTINIVTYFGNGGAMFSDDKVFLLHVWE